MKINIVNQETEFIPEDQFDYFILGRISTQVKRYDYDFENNGDERTISKFRIKNDELLSKISGMGGRDRGD